MTTEPPSETPRQPVWPPPDPPHLLAVGLTVDVLIADHLPDRTANAPIGPLLWAFAARTDASGTGAVPPVQSDTLPAVRVSPRQLGGQQ